MITRHQHTNDQGQVHTFQVDSDQGKVYLVKPDGKLQFSGTHIDPILALPQVDVPFETVPQPVAEQVPPLHKEPQFDMQAVELGDPLEPKAEDKPRRGKKDA